MQVCKYATVGHATMQMFVCSRKCVQECKCECVCQDKYVTICARMQNFPQPIAGIMLSSTITIIDLSATDFIIIFRVAVAVILAKWYGMFVH